MITTAMERRRVRRVASAVAAMSMAVVAASCGGESSSAEADPAPDPGPTSTVAPATDGDAASDTAAPAAPAAPEGGLDRTTFDLCGPVIAAGDEIATAAGFETAGADQHAELANGLCRVSGLGGDEVTVELVPAIFPSVDTYVEGYEVPAEPAPEFGDDARLIPQEFAPHVVFPFEGLVIDVKVSSPGGVERDQVVSAAATVQEVLSVSLDGA